MAGGRADIEAGAAFVRVYLKSAEFVSGIKDLESQLRGFATRLLTLGLMIKEALSPENVIRKATGIFTRFGDAVSEVAKNIGTSMMSAGKRTWLVSPSVRRLWEWRDTSPMPVLHWRTCPRVPERVPSYFRVLRLPLVRLGRAWMLLKGHFAGYRKQSVTRTQAKKRRRH
jgi:hypothetical protein